MNPPISTLPTLMTYAPGTTVAFPADTVNTANTSNTPNFIHSLLTKRNILILIVAICAIVAVGYFMKRKKDNTMNQNNQRQMMPQGYNQAPSQMMHNGYSQPYMAHGYNQMQQPDYIQENDEDQFEPQQVSQHELEALQKQLDQ
jgi:hypothetical protein